MAPSPSSIDFHVSRSDWRKTRQVERPGVALATDQVRFRIDRFALTANNISYAVAGDMLDYWGFFPVGDASEDEGWGRIPVMGFADVVESRHPDIAEGERVFGFFPMSQYLVIDAGGVGSTSFSDQAPHRSGHAPAYRQYSRCSADALYQPDTEDPNMLLRGLFMTSFLCDDFIADNDFYGARGTVIASASSKTAIALAYQVAKRARGPVIGLTSPRNADFVKSLGYYDQVVAYDDLTSLDASVPVVQVDMSGNGAVVAGLHEHFGENLKYSCIVGATHWDAGPRPADLPGPEPTFFFAPSQIVKRSQDWGPAGLQERLGGALADFIAASGAWMRVERGAGPEAVERVYRDVLEGRATPDVGHVLSMHG